MKAKVILAGHTVNNLPAAVGEIVEVDDATFRNLVAKGILEAYAEPEPKTFATPDRKPFADESTAHKKHA